MTANCKTNVIFCFNVLENLDFCVVTPTRQRGSADRKADALAR
jgi:hypothetical protein